MSYGYLEFHQVETSLRQKLRFSWVAISILLFSLPLNAQQLAGRIQGPLDTAIPTPQISSKSIGYADQSALAELKAYADAVDATAWKGMQADGTFTSSASPDALPAKLSLLPNNRVKLDVTEANGHFLTIYNGHKGKLSHPGSNDVTLSPQSSVASLAPFDLPFSALETSSNVTIIDDGLIVSDGATLHRITIESYFSEGKAADGSAVKSATDFYFDPSTHLLIKSASLMPIPGHSIPLLLKVTTYSSYKTSGQLSLPTSIAETIDGRVMWTLNLTSLDSSNLPAGSNFNF